MRLFGMDGEGNGHELVITAQVHLTTQADGESVCVCLCAPYFGLLGSH